MAEMSMFQFDFRLFSHAICHYTGNSCHVTHVTWVIQYDSHDFRFPMDIQVCRMRAESFGYNVNDVVFAWTQKEQVDMAQNLTLPQFSIKGHRYISCTKVSSDLFPVCFWSENQSNFSAIYEWDVYMHRSSVHIKTRNWLLFDSNLHSKFTHCSSKVRIR